MRMLALALALAFVACYQPADAPCTVRCEPLEACPGDQTCGADGYCHAPGDEARCVGYTVAITLGGTGAGVVRSSPPGLTCDGTSGCVATFAAGTEVTLTAAPGAGARLSAWSGACSGAAVCTFTVAGDVDIGATFNRAARLAVTLDPARRGQGAVVSTPPGIDCPGVACAATFDVDQSVVLTATAASGSRFGAWTGCPAAVGAACTVSLTGDASATAQFVRTPRVTVEVAGSTDFAIASSPGGLSCVGTTCAGVFDHGTALTITASDGVASRWKSWAGCGAAAGPCALTVDDADVALTATYRDLYDLTATLDGSGAGSVSASGLACAGASCGGTYEAATLVSLTAAPAVGSRFAGWTGCDAVVGARCDVTMAGARGVSATFVRQRQLTIDVAGSGAGSVDIAGVGSCAADCTVTVDQGPVTLTATALAGSRAAGFAGACVSGGPTCAATISADVTVTAAFVRQHTLTITAADGVTVTAPAGPCVGPGSCAALVDLGATIALSAATPRPGQELRWSTGCVGASCAVTIAGDLAVAVRLDGGHAIWSQLYRVADLTSHDTVRAVAAAPDGDVVAVGGSSGFGRFGWVARYAPDGALRWARALTVTGNADLPAVCVTASGDVIIGGSGYGTIALDATSITDTGRNDGFVARLAGTTGTAQWMVKIGGPVATHPFANDAVVGLACDGEAAIAMFTVVGPTYQVADGPVVTGAPEILWGVARLDAGGHHVWSHQVIDLPPGSYNTATALAVGGGGVHVVGWYSSQFDAGGGPIEFTGGHPSGFAVRYDLASGAHAWTRAIATNAQQAAGDTGQWAHIEAAAVDATGALVVGGYLDGSDGQRVNLGTPATPVRVTLRGDSEMFVLRLAAATGASQSVVALGSAAATGSERVRGLCAVGAELIVRGSFTTAAVEVGGVTLAGAGVAGRTDEFIARLATTGVASWAHRLGAFTYEVPATVAVTPTGEVAVGGYYTGDPDPYDAVDLPATGSGYDGFLMLIGR